MLLWRCSILIWLSTCRDAKCLTEPSKKETEILDIYPLPFIAYPKIMNRFNIPKLLQKANYSTSKSILPNKTIKTILKEDGTNVAVRGWIRSVRKQKQVSFATVNDGSNLKGIQAILNGEDAEK